MALVGVAGIYINDDHLRGLTDVNLVPPPAEGGPNPKKTYMFQIFLEGSTTAVAVSDPNIVKAAHASLLAALKSKHQQFLVSTGGATFVYTAVTIINEIVDDPVEGDKNEAAFCICMDGVSVMLGYKDFAAARAGREALIESING